MGVHYVDTNRVRCCFQHGSVEVLLVVLPVVVVWGGEGGVTGSTGENKTAGAQSSYL